MKRNHEFGQAEDHREAVKQAMEHLDAQGVPEDSLYRGLVDVNLASNEVPPLKYMMRNCWPSPAALMS